MPRIHNGERVVSSINGVGKLDVNIPKNETGPCSHTINSKWIKDLNVRPKATKILEENIGKNFIDTDLCNDLLDMTPKHRQQKQK